MVLNVVLLLAIFSFGKLHYVNSFYIYEFLEYDTTEINKTYEVFLKKTMDYFHDHLEITIPTKSTNFRFCLERDTKSTALLNLQLIILKGTICEDDETDVSGYIRNGIFFGYLHYKLAGRTLSFERLNFHERQQMNSAHSVLKSDKYSSFKNTFKYRYIKSTPSDKPKMYIKEKNKTEYSNKPFQRQIIDLTNVAEINEKTEEDIKNICSVQIDFDEEMLKNVHNNDIFRALLEMTNIMNEVNLILAENLLDSKNNPIIQYKILSYSVFKRDNITYESKLHNSKLLLEYYNSEIIHTCAKILVVDVSFDSELGIAYVGEKYGTGLCGDKSGIIITLKNDDIYLDNLAIRNIITHELGHNLGARHDPSEDCKKDCFFNDRLKECSPGGTQGMFIMFPTSSPGNADNNNKFSSCSKEQILNLAKLPHRQKCLEYSNVTFCGNGIVEHDEECDPGVDSDNCCYGSNEPNEDLQCKLKSGVKCSPSQGPCCDMDCNFRDTTYKCSIKRGCLAEQFCGGNTAVCPEPKILPEDTYCKHDTYLCDKNGKCKKSICLLYSKEPAECTESRLSCTICCKKPGSHQAKPLLVNGEFVRFISGELCKDGTGLCNKKHECITNINDSQFSNFLIKLLKGTYFEIIKDFFRKKFWLLVGSVAGVLIILIIITKWIKSDLKSLLKKKYCKKEKEILKSLNRQCQNVLKDKRQDDNIQSILGYGFEMPLQQAYPQQYNNEHSCNKNQKFLRQNSINNVSGNSCSCLRSG